MNAAATGNINLEDGIALSISLSSDLQQQYFQHQEQSSLSHAEEHRQFSSSLLIIPDDSQQVLVESEQRDHTNLLSNSDTTNELG